MSDPKITREEVRHVATLARLALSEDEIERMQATLDSILGYMAELSALDLEGVEPTFHAVAMAARFREDTVRPSLEREEALAAAPATEAGGFAVPRVLEGES
ncbi:MAG: Asp-tRNA(Asn)/Glu-tRNA(Gln) amidotransferase subunit GatC [Polyangiaceae bacterium]|nr:Asp-tRNA(Asn)/Glu-tRNA(Gln) amidotransferase subunit GatC [Polyangiaceae bacterium]